MLREPVSLARLVKRYPGSASAISALMKVLKGYVPDEDVANVLLAHVAHIVEAVEHEAEPRKRPKARKVMTNGHAPKLAKCPPQRRPAP